MNYTKSLKVWENYRYKKSLLKKYKKLAKLYCSAVNKSNQTDPPTLPQQFLVNNHMKHQVHT